MSGIHTAIVSIDGIYPLASLRFVGAAFLLSLYTAQARGVTKPNLVLGIALGLGGLGQTLAGILEWASGNTHGVSVITLPGMLCSGEESQELRCFAFWKDRLYCSTRMAHFGFLSQARPFFPAPF